MNEQPTTPSDEDAPEPAEASVATPDDPTAKPEAAEIESAEELVADAVADALVTEAVADAAIDEALEETVAEAVLDAAAVEEASDAQIQEAFEDRVEEAVESGLEGDELVAAIDEAAVDADVQEAIADTAIEEALEETVAEAVADARAVEAVSDAAIAEQLADDLETIAEAVEAEESATESVAQAEAAETPEPEATDQGADTGETIASPAAQAEAAPEEEEPETAVRDPFRGPGDWYVVHTYAGYENKVKTNLESRIHTMQMEDKIFDVHIPMEDVMEIKGGKKQVVQRKVFPGYLLVKMVYDNDSWYVVRNTPGVTGFVAAGTGSKPTPLSKREVEKILAVKKEEVKPQFRLGFEEQDVVRIISGPFADFNGTISEINLDQSKLKVLVNIFDRETPVELSFDQVAKV
jgi:transcriptional antiterminator NusG